MRTPFDASAAASVRSFAARKAGSRSGSSRQKAKPRLMFAREKFSSSTSSGPTIPSMSVPTWTWASKSSAPSGVRRAASAS